MALSHHSGSASRTELQLVSLWSGVDLKSRRYLVGHGLGTKLVVFQGSFALLDGEAACAGEHPFVILAETDAAIAGHDGSYLWDLQGELEGSAVTVAAIGLEFVDYFCHRGR